jgi:ADP-ribosyl-[dinitrogen reductase] hydrolase
MTPVSMQSRIAGCLLAGALGDAIGAHYEGKASCTDFAVPASLRITDDTQLTLATCDSLIEIRGVVPESIAKHFVRWFQAGRLRGLGASTLKALTELSAGGHWALVGATGERSAGSGAAMRVAPLAFVLEPTRPTDRQTIRDVCRITHRNDEAYVGALAILISIRHLANGQPLDRTLVPMLVDSIPDSQVRDRFLFIRDSSNSPTRVSWRIVYRWQFWQLLKLAISFRRSSDLSGVEGILTR